MKITNRLASAYFNFLLNSTGYRKRSRLINRYWKRLSAIGMRYFSGQTVSIRIHGEKTWLNYGYTYPMLCREYSSYNLPLVELAYRTYESKGSQISVVDVGAAIGDTVLLLEASCRDFVKHYYCIDGDDEFYLYLKSNLADNSRVTLINAFLSSTSNGMAKNLVRIHAGTASAQGSNGISTTSLDHLFSNGQFGEVDLIKIDVDGYDGLVLSGAKKILAQCLPTIIFEWHPLICKDAGNDSISHFLALQECGYTRFIWFDNYGNFSHFMTGVDSDAVNSLANLCIARQHAHAVYYDIIALPPNSQITNESLAGLGYAKRNKHPF